MSYEGKILRGWKWYQYRNQDGVLPKDIQDCEGMMVDVKTFLEFCEGKDMEKINELCNNYFYKKIRKKQFKDALKNIAPIAPIVKEETKSKGRK